MSNQVDPAHYQSQLNTKADKLSALFAEFNPPQLEIFASPELHFRMRAEFRIWHDGDNLDYIMFDQKTKQRYAIHDFPIASKLINQLMPLIRDEIKAIPTLRKKLFQIDYLSTLSGECLVSFLYHKQLNNEWIEEAKALKERLIKQGFKINFIGRARKQKVVLDQEFVIEKLNVNDKEYTYKQVENSFTQPNGKVAQKMLEWAVDCTKESKGDLLELYCGNGNFSIALAQNFTQVLATELAKPSVESAQYNIKENGIDNLQIIRMSAEDFTDAMNGVREFRRLKDQGVELSHYNCQTIFVDPPRAGMDEETCKMVQNYDRILYISCNPNTLKDNLDILGNTHNISRFALFDQFPYTDHMEAGVLLERRK